MVAASGHGRGSLAKAESGSGATTRSPTPGDQGDQGGSSGGSTPDQLGPPEPPPFARRGPFARRRAEQAAHGPPGGYRSPSAGSASATGPPSSVQSARAAAPRARHRQPHVRALASRCCFGGAASARGPRRSEEEFLELPPIPQPASPPRAPGERQAHWPHCPAPPSVPPAPLRALTSREGEGSHRGGAAAVRRAASERPRCSADGLQGRDALLLDGARGSAAPWPQCRRRGSCGAARAAAAAEPLAALPGSATPSASSRAGHTDRGERRGLVATLPAVPGFCGGAAPTLPRHARPAGATPRPGRPAAAPRTAAHVTDGEKTPSESDETMLESCLGCANLLLADAVFCRRCGEQRSMRRDVAAAFRTLIGDRSIFRLEDLNFMALSVRRLQEAAAPGGVDMTMYRLKAALEQHFQRLRGSQREAGECCTQGLTQRSFQALLTAIATMLGVTGRTVALWLADEDRCLKGGLVQPRAKFDGRPVSPRDVRHPPCAPSTKDALDAVRGHVEQRCCALPCADPGGACLDRCDRCGTAFPSDAHYCRRCGTERRTQAVEEEERTRKEEQVDDILHLSKKHKLPVEVVKARKAVFRELDADGNGRLSSDELLRALRKRYNIPPGAEALIPRRRCEVLNGDRSAGIDFEEYLLWSVSVGETEDGFECNVKDRELRKFAAMSGLYLPDVEGARATFDRFAEGGARRLEQAAFPDVLSFLMKVSKPSSISQNTVRRHWLTVAGFDASKTSVSLEEFLNWYFKTSFLR